MPDHICQGCGGSNRERSTTDGRWGRLKGTGKLCHACRKNLDESEALREKVVAYERKIGFAGISETYYDWPYLHTPGRSHTKEDDEVKECLETIRIAIHMIAKRMPTISATHAPGKALGLVDGISDWRGVRVVPRDVLLAFRAMHVALRRSVVLAYEQGRADGRDILQQLANGELPIDFQDERPEERANARDHDREILAQFEAMAKDGACPWCFGQKKLECGECEQCKGGRPYVDGQGRHHNECRARVKCHGCKGTGKFAEVDEDTAQAKIGAHEVKS